MQASVRLTDDYLREKNFLFHKHRLSPELLLVMRWVTSTTSSLSEVAYGFGEAL
jgi:hypothetical protein